MGAAMRGVALDKPLGDRLAGFLQDALLEYQVLTFPDQSLTPGRVLELARLFGKPEVHPIHAGMSGSPEIIRLDKRQGEADPVGERARTIASHFVRPSKVVLCYCDDVSANCDFLFSSLTRAWEGLSPPVQEFLRDLRAIHSGENEFAPPNRDSGSFMGRSSTPLVYSDAIYACIEHPLVHTHPDTGKTSLYVNEAFTRRICGLSEGESNALLEFLVRHTALPEYGCRIPSEPGTLTIWDNRVTTQRSTRYPKHQSRRFYLVAVASGEELALSADWPISAGMTN